MRGVQVNFMEISRAQDEWEVERADIGLFKLKLACRGKKISNSLFFSSIFNPENPHLSGLETEESSSTFGEQSLFMG